MQQFIIQGRGGQGAQMAGKILAEMYFQQGRHVQSYATYGGARKGTPVSSLLRVDDKPIRLRCDIEHPDMIVCFDPSLLEGGILLRGATARTLVVINSSLSAESFRPLGDFRVATVDARSIARKYDLGRIVNTTLVGAALGSMDDADPELLKKVIRETSPAKTENNIAASMEGYRIVREGGC